MVSVNSGRTCALVAAPAGKLDCQVRSRVDGSLGAEGGSVEGGAALASPAASSVTRLALRTGRHLKSLAASFGCNASSSSDTEKLACTCIGDGQARLAPTGLGASNLVVCSCRRLLSARSRSNMFGIAAAATGAMTFDIFPQKLKRRQKFAAQRWRSGRFTALFGVHRPATRSISPFRAVQQYARRARSSRRWLCGLSDSPGSGSRPCSPSLRLQK